MCLWNNDAPSSNILQQLFLESRSWSRSEFYWTWSCLKGIISRVCMKYVKSLTTVFTVNKMLRCYNSFQTSNGLYDISVLVNISSPYNSLRDLEITHHVRDAEMLQCPPGPVWSWWYLCPCTKQISRQYSAVQPGNDLQWTIISEIKMFFNRFLARFNRVLSGEIFYLQFPFFNCNNY